jgi:hypothetical protein
MYRSSKVSFPACLRLESLSKDSDIDLFPLCLTVSARNFTAGIGDRGGAGKTLRHCCCARRRLPAVPVTLGEARDVVAVVSSCWLVRTAGRSSAGVTAGSSVGGGLREAAAAALRSVRPADYRSCRRKRWAGCGRCWGGAGTRERLAGAAWCVSLRALCCLVEVSLSFNAVAFRCSSPRTCPPRYQALAAGFGHCAAATSRDGLADAVASAAGLVLVASLSLAYR